MELNPEGWSQRYRDGRTGWDRGRVHPALVEWVNRQPDPCQIVVPGCGRGHEVVYLAQRGFEVTAIDFAALPLQELRQKLDQQKLTASLRQVDLFEFQPPSQVDVVYEQTCYCAISPDLRDAYERQVRAWLRPGGRLIALLMQTGREGGPPFHCDWEETRRRFGSDHWKCEVDQPTVYPHPAGKLEEWLIEWTRQ